jgi:hypothetical protein
MEIKKCKVCNIEKPTSEYHKCIKANATYLRSYCKECGRKQRRKWRESLKDGFWTVYYLPDTHYIGITSCLYERMKEHERRGKNTNNYKVIGKYKKATEAAIVEAVYHNNGYNGFNYKKIK